MDLIWIYSICSCVDILFIHLFWFYGHKEALNMKSLDIFKAITYLNCTVIKIILATTRLSSIFPPLNKFTYYSHLRNSGPQNEALSYKTQHTWERQWHSLTFPSTHPSSFPTPLTIGSGQWAATQAAMHQLQAEARKSQRATLLWSHPALATTQRTIFPNGVAARGELGQLGLPLTYEEHTVRVRSNRCWVKLRGDEFDLLLQQSLAYPDLTNGHPPPWTSPSHHGPGCKELLVQWPEHTKLLLGTLPLLILLLNPRMPFPTLFCPPPHPAIRFILQKLVQI